MIPERYDFSSVFDNSICVTQSEIRWETVYPESPIKGSRRKNDGIMTSAEINDLIERLTAPKPSKEVTQQSKSQMQLTQRLFNEGVSKKSDDKSTEVSELILEDSKIIAESKLRNNIEDAFGGAHEIPKAKMTEIFTKLGILEEGEDLNWRSMYRDLMDEWRLDEDLYDADEARHTLLSALEGDRSTLFKRTARKKMMVKYHNKKEPKIPTTKDAYTGSHTLSRDVLDRITAAPKSEPKVEPPLENTAPLSSRKSRQICNYSEHGKKSFLERGKELEERRLGRLSKIEESSMPKRRATKSSTNLTEEDVARIMARKEEKKRQLELETTPSYRPSVTKYKEYLKKKKAIESDWSKAPGYEKDVERHRNAYQMSQMKKEEEKKMLELPPCKRTKPPPPRVIEEHNYKILNPPQLRLGFI